MAASRGSPPGASTVLSPRSLTLIPGPIAAYGVWPRLGHTVPWKAARVLWLSDTQFSRFQGLKVAETAWSMLCGAALLEWPLEGSRVG